MRVSVPLPKAVAFVTTTEESVRELSKTMTVEAFTFPAVPAIMAFTEASIVVPVKMTSEITSNRVELPAAFCSVDMIVPTGIVTFPSAVLALEKVTVPVDSTAAVLAKAVPK